MAKITVLREDIDEIDNRIIESILARRKIRAEIVEIKEKQGIPLKDPERERVIIERLKAKYPEIDADFVEKLYALILGN